MLQHKRGEGFIFRWRCKHTLSCKAWVCGFVSVRVCMRMHMLAGVWSCTNRTVLRKWISGSEYLTPQCNSPSSDPRTLQRVFPPVVWSLSFGEVVTERHFQLPESRSWHMASCGWQTETPQQLLLDGWRWVFAGTFMVPRGWIHLTLMILSVFLWRHHEVHNLWFFSSETSC